ncbi:DNA phosphorothioation-dependent restriction protein DptG [Pneumocystis murina B123]|uniref:DNA phosphorothioation-dependent restriction protein DptG n=1 Tax=Pneumocystis murina (strain B123) TaxID=1069680 RepID=M7NSI7_PNEMU|nr:DNA phosphorothioation-dependent restriction protein DptG [Pneumocystis murina B123]EMR11713.1 DNA phosphorothioation-dependent restriction protein DptG [Pneumocystis murina B123]
MSSVPFYLPILYLSILLGSLSLFSFFYTKYKRLKISPLEEWFSSNISRDIYFSLLHLSDSVPTNILKAALLERAKENLKRIHELRLKKTVLNQAVQRGLLSNDLWKQFRLLEKELELEVMDISREAQSFRKDWGQLIFQTANEMVLNEQLRQNIMQIRDMAEKEGKRYEKLKKISEKVKEEQKRIAESELLKEVNSLSSSQKKKTKI